MNQYPYEPQPTSDSAKHSFLAFFGITTRGSKFFLTLSLGVIVLMAGVSYSLMAPRSFPEQARVTIEEGFSLGEASLLLKERGLIRSRTAFEFCALSMGGDKGVLAGEYLFKEPLSSCALAKRLVKGVTGIPALRLTFPEGLSVEEIASIAEKSLTEFDKEAFLTRARADEGYLFPETYFFISTATEEDVLKAMKEEFVDKTKALSGGVEKSGYKLGDVVIMASILEKEARTPEDQALVAGILWKRMDMGMRLQVDAPFLYLLGKTSAQLTQADLKMASGYNTYTNKGLPVAPIGNPGLSALKAAINPKLSPYLYYLSDNDGGMHYAKTFEEHKANKVKYLR